MRPSVFRFKQKLNLAKRATKAGLGHAKTGAVIAGGFAADEYRTRQVDKIRRVIDKQHLKRAERRQALKSQEQSTLDGRVHHTGMSEEQLNEYVLTIGRALARPAAKVVPKGKILSKMGKTGSWLAGKGRNVRVVHRAKRIKAARFARNNPIKSKVLSTSKAFAGETAFRTATDVGSHVASNYGKDAADKQLVGKKSGYSGEYSNINRIRSTEREVPQRSMPQAHGGRPHTKANAAMAIRRSEMRGTPTLPSRQPTRQRTNVSDDIVDIAGNIHEIVSAAIVPQFKAANDKIAKPIAKKITKPIRKESLDEVGPLAMYGIQGVAAGHVKRVNKVSKAASRKILSKGIAPAAEKWADFMNRPRGAIRGKLKAGAAMSARKFKAGASWSGSKLKAGASWSGSKLKAGASAAKLQAGKFRARVKKHDREALAHAKKMDAKEGIDREELIQEIATTAIGVTGATLGGAALIAHRMKTRNARKFKKLTKKSEKAAKKAQDYKVQARIGRAIQRGGQGYNRRRFQAKAASLRKKAAQFPVNENWFIRNPQDFEKKAAKKMVKSAKLKAKAQKYGARQHAKLMKRAAKFDARANRYGGTEKFGQSPKKKITGSSTARIVA